jgi:hypothetical protein
MLEAYRLMHIHARILALPSFWNGQVFETFLVLLSSLCGV